MFRISYILIAAMLVITSNASAETPPGDTRDVLMLLREGPLHIRFHITLREKSLSARRDEYLTELIEKLDRNGDGKLSQSERKKSSIFSYGRRKFDNPFLESLKETNAATRRDVERDLSRFGELFSYRQDESAAENDLKVFELLDSDASGEIDIAEMRLAVVRVAEKDRDRDQCVSFQEFAPPPPPVDPLNGPLAEEDPGPPKSHLSKVLRDTGNITLSRDLLRAYDKNRDHQLTSAEIGWDQERFTVIDHNSDGKLSINEMRNIDRTPVDLELTVDLAEIDQGGAMKVVQSSADRRLSASRPDLVKVAFGKTTVTFSYRSFDPVESAIENGRQRFNQMDLDGNGYLDREEITGNARFERTLFAAMDTDEDEKLFAEEFETYVRTVCEPASMTCHVNVYDTGPGYFQILDSNSDGRISIRELRELEGNLAAHATTAGQGIRPDEMGRHYFVEFVRGSFQVFGPSQRLIAQGPTFIERDPVGPSWFKALDRNRDGDLTYLVDNPLYPPEFIFHPEEAVRMDTDGDGLINHKEAEAYETRLTKRDRSD